MVLDASRTALWALVLSAASMGSTACSSSSALAPATPPGAPACPDGYVATSGASCSLEGQSCPVLYTCDAFSTPATCVCTSGTFVCASSAPSAEGGVVVAADGGVSPVCPALSASSTCPPIEAMAAVASCTDLQLQCAYPSACASIPAFDICQCVPPRNASEGTHFECTPSCDLPDASLLDGSSDAASNDARTPDATPTDASNDGTAPSLDGAVSP